MPLHMRYTGISESSVPFFFYWQKDITMRLLGIIMAALIMAGNVYAMDLIKDGKPTATIVLPEVTEYDDYVNATPEELEAYLKERFPNASDEDMEKARKALPGARAREIKRIGDEEELAIEELVNYIKKISGAELPVVRLKKGDKLPAGNLILMGAELARKDGNGKTLDKLHRDGYIIKAKGNKLYLSGQRARGTLYSVYTLLESLGCRWVMPTEFGDFIPSMQTISIDLDTVDNPPISSVTGGVLTEPVTATPAGLCVIRVTSLPLWEIRGYSRAMHPRCHLIMALLKPTGVYWSRRWFLTGRATKKAR